MRKLLLGISTLLLLMTACKSGKYADLGDGIYADIQTNKGDIVVKLHKEATPVTVANFVSLAEGNNPFVSEEFKDKKYYDGLTFHRIIKDFMSQGGDPTGTGSGSPGYKFKDEFVDTLQHNKKGILSMANSGPKTNGSQFFITHKETPWLNGKHTVFGEVVKGIEVVDSIAAVKTGSGDKPVEPVTMNKVEIIRNGKDAKKFDAIKVMQDYFKEEEEVIAAMKKMKEDFAFEIAEQLEKAETLESGLKVLKLNDANGRQPQMGQQVLVNYAGYFTDGNLFDSNIEEVAAKYGQLNPGRRDQGGYRPFPMVYGPEAKLIPGFREGLQTMKVGDKVRLFIPPHLGYGDNDYGPIPGGSTLVFDLEITGIAE
ncbi:peptidylprolyl isomerase [Croceivirga sp. JEA036]|uniref:peptidylprolyl isomerase n=1 Tax=Croceivirga sp. JEA036 TaxID=2721162 RepID=UPI001439EC71|nr:peptidylprolyl isomerase [Croceivirga sp. JEA036]NJB37634.1 peptidylprolyl isomerase [Croceivirga sp. JEA036]